MIEVRPKIAIKQFNGSMTERENVCMCMFQVHKFELILASRLDFEITVYYKCGLLDYKTGQECSSLTHDLFIVN